MSDQERIVFLTAYRMALADGELTAHEARLLHLFSKGLRLSTDELFRAKQQAETIDWEALPATFPDQADRLALFETICLVAIVDGRVDPREWELVNRLARRFEIDWSTAQQCLAAAQARFQDLARTHELFSDPDQR